MQTYRFLIFSLLLFLVTGLTHAQDEPVDSEEKKEPEAKEEAILLQPGMDTTGMNIQFDSIYVDEEQFSRPKKAAYLSAALPGLGQAFNKRYWKIPIVYGAFGTIGYFIGYNNNKYQQYRNAYLLKKSFPVEELDDELAINISEDNLQRGLDYYRRNRDLLMIVLVGVYIIQILDAHIDAHLMEFDVSEDLTFRLEPGFQSQSMWVSQQYGFKLTLNFN
jgi:hypothetical protein